ncbi:alpha/beta hydrolase [Nocardia lasii]|uniref:Alpha/beta hydrolase n=1 Tax=Nocardia lasii TaxID=1616107 RepID=A0ABW1JMX3_9NOCA
MTPKLPGVRAPGLPLLTTEYARAAGEFGVLAATWPALAAAPTGAGQPVLVLPGLSAVDLHTAPLRLFLRSLGYPVYRWGLGPNIGPTRRILDGMRTRLDEIAETHGEPVSVIGWSLGGIFARRLARETPEVVRQVITLGSPIKLARHRQSNARHLYRLFDRWHTQALTLPLEEGEGPLPVPSSALYSRLDGIVAWQVCRDQPGAAAENIEVLCSHLGFPNNLASMWLIADRLSQPAGELAPFVPPAWLRFAYPGS